MSAPVDRFFFDFQPSNIQQTSQLQGNRQKVVYDSIIQMYYCPLSILFLLGLISCSLSSLTFGMAMKPPIVYTIAGSDSGGGAGIQADLKAIQSMGCHGCSAITCLTAQNSVGVTAVHSPPVDFLKKQLETLLDDLTPIGIKIGMLGTAEIIGVVGDILKQMKKNSSQKIWIVLDPVMISTSGSKLIDDDAVEAMIRDIFPLADIVTPNKFEAEALLKRELRTPEDVELGAKDLLGMGCKGVLIKGGHTLTEEKDTAPDLKPTLAYAQDYLLTADKLSEEGEERLCDGATGVWLRTTRWENNNTHGTGCTLSSSIASALALGEQKRKQQGFPEGATSVIALTDACCLAKAYVSAGIKLGVKLGNGPGPVVQTQFPSSFEHFPRIVTNPVRDVVGFRQLKSFSSSEKSDDGVPELGRILPIVDTVDWVRQLAQTSGITDIQLRIKDVSDREKVVKRVKLCQKLCQDNGVRLWINDHWEAAIEAGCFGVHVGQEDLFKCIKAGGLKQLQTKNIALGISTHSYGELAAALGVKPSYISLGPIFATSSKKVGFDPQGLGILSKWRQLIPPDIPLVTIGGINDVQAARQNKESGSDCIAVIGAVTTVDEKDLSQRIADLNHAMS